MQSSRKIFSLVSVLMVTLLACNLTSVPASPPASTEPPVIEPTNTETAVNSNVPSQTPEPLLQTTPSATSTPITAQITAQQGVVFTVNSESLNIRRGPGIYYNVVGVIAAVQSVSVLARDVTGGWLYIAIPNAPTTFGWVAVVTQYSSVSGDLNTLETKSVAPAESIYIKNCTYHAMEVSPGGFILSGQTYAPDNSKQVTPGTYTVTDTTVNMQVAAQTLFEGDTLVIYTDGLNNTYMCP